MSAFPATGVRFCDPWCPLLLPPVSALFRFAVPLGGTPNLLLRLARRQCAGCYVRVPGFRLIISERGERSETHGAAVPSRGPIDLRKIRGGGSFRCLVLLPCGRSDHCQPLPCAPCPKPRRSRFNRGMWWAASQGSFTGRRPLPAALMRWWCHVSWCFPLLPSSSLAGAQAPQRVHRSSNIQ